VKDWQALTTSMLFVLNNFINMQRCFCCCGCRHEYINASNAGLWKKSRF